MIGQGIGHALLEVYQVEQARQESLGRANEHLGSQKPEPHVFATETQCRPQDDNV